MAISALIGLVGLASDGPGFLAPQRKIDVIFRDGQGIRIGSPVRVAGLDSGNVVDLDLVPVEGTLRAKVRISLPAKLVKMFREDVRITIQPALTGMSHVNIVSTGPLGSPPQGRTDDHGDRDLVLRPHPRAGRPGAGRSRNDIRHMIAQARDTVDSAVPRLKQFLASVEETSTNMKEMGESLRPSVESMIGQFDEMARRIRVNTPRIESTIARVDEISGQVQGIVTENRENVRQTMSSVRDLAASLTDVVGKDRLKVERLLDGLDVMRARAERVLYQADQIAGQIAAILVRGRVEIERSITNVRDATDWGKKLVQKIYANPFVLSPFYKPNHEDLRVRGSTPPPWPSAMPRQELRDAVKTIDVMSSRPANPQQQEEIQKIRQRLITVTNQLNETSQRLAEALKQSNGRERLRR